MKLVKGKWVEITREVISTMIHLPRERLDVIRFAFDSMFVYVCVGYLYLLFIG